MGLFHYIILKMCLKDAKDEHSLRDLVVYLKHPFGSLTAVSYGKIGDVPA